MQIKNCEVEDIEQAAMVFCQAYAAPPYNESWDLVHASAYLQRFQEIDPAGCFVAERDKEIVGGIFSFSYPWHSGKLTCIQELFVSELCRRQGGGPRVDTKSKRKDRWWSVVGGPQGFWCR